MVEIYKLVNLKEITKENLTRYFAVLYVSKQGRDYLCTKWVNKETGEYLKILLTKMLAI